MIAIGFHNLLYSFEKKVDVPHTMSSKAYAKTESLASRAIKLCKPKLLNLTPATPSSHISDYSRSEYNSSANTEIEHLCCI